MYPMAGQDQTAGTKSDGNNNAHAASHSAKRNLKFTKIQRQPKTGPGSAKEILLVHGRDPISKQTLIFSHDLFPNHPPLEFLQNRIKPGRMATQFSQYLKTGREENMVGMEAVPTSSRRARKASEEIPIRETVLRESKKPRRISKE